MPPTKGGKRPIPFGGKGKGKRTAGKGAKGGEARKKKGHHKKQQHWDLYIHRTLRQMNKRGTISKAAIRVLSSFVEDMFNKIQSEAVHVARINKKKTLSATEIQISTRLLLPVELAKHSLSEATKALSTYYHSRDELYPKP